MNKLSDTKAFRENLSHGELTQKAVKWLLSYGCSVVMSEIKCWNNSGEIVDALGFTSSISVLIEAKATRPDFLSDKKKKFRMRPEMGVGQMRFFMTNKGIIKPEELPEKWGLLEVSGSRVSKTVFPKHRYYPSIREEWFHDCNHRSERSMLVSACRRLGVYQQGIEGKIYFKEKGLTQAHNILNGEEDGSI